MANKKKNIMMITNANIETEASIAIAGRTSSMMMMIVIVIRVGTLNNARTKRARMTSTLAAA